MDKQLIFFLILSFLFLIGGVISKNIILQLAGIIILVFLIYDYYFNFKEKKKYANNYVKKMNFIMVLGNIDLALGGLLLMRGFGWFVPFGVILFLTVILFLKGFVFACGGDVASMLDILSVGIIVSSGIAEIPLFIIIGVSIYLIQKGALSFFS